MSIIGSAARTYFKVARWPVDRALGLLGARPGAPAETVVDRAEAVAKETAGAVAGDKGLKEEGRKQGRAAEKRGDAQRLRSRAQERKRTAQSREEMRKQKAEAERRDRIDGAEGTAAERRRRAEAKAEREQEQVEKRGRGARLEALEEQQEALDEREAALTAEDEAKRLGKAAAREKRARKAART